MARFAYHRPDSLEAAVALLAAHGSDAKVLAGGQSLVPVLNLGLAAPPALIDINRTGASAEPRLDDGVVRIGPLVRHRTLERTRDDIDGALPVLRPAAAQIGHVAIRTRGTMLGSLAHADPAAEWPAVAVLLDATLVARSARGERAIPAATFFRGPLDTALEADELLVAATFRPAPPHAGAAVLELTYRHGDYAIVGVAAQVVLAKPGFRDSDAGDPLAGVTLTSARIGLFGVHGTAVRAPESEAILVGGPLDTERVTAAGEAASRACDPASDPTASAAYRREMVAVYVRRAVRAAVVDARRRAAAPPTVAA